jgi:hypothetical protein
MFSTQHFSVRQIMSGGASLTVSLSVALALSGCSLFSHNTHEQEVTATQPAAAVDSGSAAADSPQTVTEGLEPVVEDANTTTVISDAGPALRSEAPKNYVVQRGDTLWGIANKFLRDPWLWPEIWYVNPEIENPHRIYPGDTVHLALARDGSTVLQVVRGNNSPAVRLEPLLRSTVLVSPIPTIPYSVISAFLARPGVLSLAEVKAAPYILALRDEHDIAGTGDEIYVKKLNGATGALYSVMHVDEPLKDPDSGRHLGYLAIYTGTAQLMRPGTVAKAMMSDAARETLQGDVLIREEGANSSDFKPHPPARQVTGRVIAVVEGEDLSGQYDVVALNRGAKDGLDRGTVLTADAVPAKTDDLCARIEERSTCLFHASRVLPSEAAGTLLVFKTYQDMSYALILSESTAIHVHDRVRNP